MKIFKTVYGDWQLFRYCKSCKKFLTSDQVEYNNAICPHCGVCGTYTKCDYFTKVGRFVRTKFLFFTVKTELEFQKEGEE